MEERLWSKMQKYTFVFTLSFWQALKNTKALLGLSIFLIACLVIFAHIWKIIAAKNGISFFSGSQLLWYIAFNEWLLVSLPDIHEEMGQDLKTGKLAYLLPRPISYLGFTFAGALGTLFANLFVLGLVTFTFTWIQTGALPFSPLCLLTAILLGACAGALAIILQMIIGLSSFWMGEADPLYWIYEKLLFLFGGLILPLAAYPSWLQKIANFTPFPAILGERSALALSFSSFHLISLLLSFVGWAAIGTGVLIFLYRKGLRTLNIEGG